MSILADCPFCGGSATSWIVDREKLHPYKITCDACGAATPFHGNFDACLKAWNTRAPEPTPQDNAEIVERVAEAMRAWTTGDPDIRGDVWVHEHGKRVARFDDPDDAHWHVRKLNAISAIRSLSSSRGEAR